MSARRGYRVFAQTPGGWISRSVDAGDAMRAAESAFSWMAGTFTVEVENTGEVVKVRRARSIDCCEMVSE